MKRYIFKRKFILFSVFGIAFIFCALPFYDCILFNNQIYPIAILLNDSIFNFKKYIAQDYLIDNFCLLVNIPQALFSIKQIINFQLPLWDPFSGCGAPLFASFSHGLFAPWNIVLLFSPTIKAFDYIFIIKIWLQFLGFFILGRQLKYSYISCFIGSMAFSFSATNLLPYNSLYIQNNNSVIFPWMLIMIHRFLAKQSYNSTFGVCFIISLMIVIGHPTAVIFYFIFITLYILFQNDILRNFYISKNTIKYIIFSLIIILLLSALQIIPFLQFLSQGWTYKIYKPIVQNLNYCIHPASILTFFYPFPFGIIRGTGIAQWHANTLPLNLPPGCFYFGIIPFILSIVGIRKDTRHLWIPFLLSCITILDMPILNVFKYIPFVRTSYRLYLIPIPIFFMSMLAMHGGHLLQEQKISKKICLNTLLIIISFGIFCLIVILFGSHFNWFYLNKLFCQGYPLKYQLQLNFSFYNCSWFWVLLYAVLIWYLLKSKFKFQHFFNITIACITIVDLWLVSLHMVPRNRATSIPIPDAIQWLQNHIQHYRATSLSYGNSLLPVRLNLLWNIRDVRNCDAIFPLRYRMFMEILNPDQRV